MRRQWEVNEATSLSLQGLCAMLASSVLWACQDRSDAVWVLVPVTLWAVVAWRPASGRALGWTLLVALAFRGVFVGTPPLLSDDLYRYLWEGRMLAAGLNPFVMAPSTVVGLDDGLRALVNHPNLTSIYPPVALLWFRLLDLLGGGSGVAQGATALADLVTVWLLHRFVGRAAAMTWATNPLVVLEAAHGAHIDFVALPFAVAAVATARPALAVWAAGIKVFPLLLLGRLIRRGGWETGAALVVLFLLATPVWGAGLGLFATATTFATTWSFNGFLWPWMAPALGVAVSRLLLGALGLAAVAVATVRASDGWTAWRWIGIAFLATSPTVHPWYAVWALLPSVVLGHNDLSRAALPLLWSYAVLIGLDAGTGAWSEPPWLWWVVWVPAGSAMLWGPVTRWRSRWRPE